MEIPPQSDLVCLYLHAAGTDPAEPSGDADRRDGSGTPAGNGGRARTVQGIGAALELERESTAQQTRLLSTLATLEEEGLVTGESRSVGGTTRTVYRLTDEGRRRAAALRDRIAGQTVTVTNGDASEVAVEDLGRYFESYPLVRAITRVSGDGTIRLREVGGEFVDREAELERVEAALSTAAQQGSRTVLVSGEAGVGKTSLVEQLLATAREEGFRVATGRGRRTGDRPYGPLVSAFRDLPDSEALVDPLESAADLDVDAPEVFEAQRTALFNEVADALRDRAEAEPVVLFVDDHQWAGADARRLFVHLTRTVTEWPYPVLFVATYRVEDAAADEEFDADVRELAGAERTEHVELGPLPAADVHGLVAWLTDRPDLPDEFFDSVREGTGGNPLLLREAVQGLVDAGGLDPDGDPVTPPDDLPVPEDVTSVVETRLAALRSDTRDVLEAAAVAGETVAPDLVAAVLDEDEAAVNDRLDVLVTGRFLERAADGVAFVSDLVREAIADRLDPERRRSLHAATAGALRSADPDVVYDRAARIAHHYEGAGDPRAALSFYRRAGDRAREVYAHEEAVEAYERALSLARDLGDDGAVVEVLEALGDTTATMGRYGTARDRFAAARDRASGTATRQRLFRKTADTFNDQGDYDRAIETAREGLAITGDEGSLESTDATGSDGTEASDGGEGDPGGPATAPTASREVAGLLAVASRGLVQTGNLEAARTAAVRARECARAVDAPERELVALRRLGTVARLAGNYATAAEYLEASLSIARELDDRSAVAASLNALGSAANARGEIDAAEDRFEEALAIHRETGNRKGQASALVSLSSVAMARGNAHDAETRLEEALSTFREIGDRQGEASALGNLAHVAEEAGDLDAVAEYHERSLAIKREIGDRRGQAISHNNLGLIARNQGALDAAEEHFREALSIFRAIGARDGAASALVSLGGIARERGDAGTAAEYYGDALATFRAIGDSAGEAGCRFTLGKVLRERGDREAAAEHLAAALETFREVGIPGGEGSTLIARGTLAIDRGNLDRAADDVAEGLELVRDAGDRMQEIEGLLARARLACERGDLDAAAEDCEEALSIARESGHRLERLTVLERLAEIHERRGDAAAAREHCEVALDLIEESDADALADRAATFRELLSGLDDGE